MRRLVVKALGWIIALCGLWEAADIVLPFVIGFGNVQALVWSHIIAGIILMIAGVWAALTSEPGTAETMYWAATIAGLWLIGAPFLAHTPVNLAGAWNDIIVGIIVLILSSASGLLVPRG